MISIYHNDFDVQLMYTKSCFVKCKKCVVLQLLVSTFLEILSIKNSTWYVLYILTLLSYW